MHNKKARDKTAEARLCIYKNSLEKGIVPEDIQTAKFIPVFKQGDKASPGNIRPVSLKSFVAQIGDLCPKI